MMNIKKFHSKGIKEVRISVKASNPLLSEGCMKDIINLLYGGKTLCIEI
jgi:hypothetical protein